jgi:hypothetical protein
VVKLRASRIELVEKAHYFFWASWETLVPVPVDTRPGMSREVVLMASSRLINDEVSYAVRLLLSTVPSLRAPAEQRSDYQLVKAEVFELLAATDPSIAAQALQLANAARREAHAINLDY